MAWNRSTPNTVKEKKPAKKFNARTGVLVGLILVAATVAAVFSFHTNRTAVSAKSVASEGKPEPVSLPKHSKLIPAVTPAPASMSNVVAEKLQGCDFLVNRNFKQKAKVYLCLFSASWCPPCRAEMPRIAKIYAEMLQSDPDIELIHFSRDKNDEKALAWAKEHDVKFPVVKPKGGNPLDLHTSGIPHLFILKADGTLVEEGHPMRLFTDSKLRELKRR